MPPRRRGILRSTDTAITFHTVSSVGKISWRRKEQPTPILLPRKLHGWRSLVGYSLWGRKESDTIEQLFTFTVNNHF